MPKNITGPMTAKCVKTGPQIGSFMCPVSAATQKAVLGIAHSRTPDMRMDGQTGKEGTKVPAMQIAHTTLFK